MKNGLRIVSIISVLIGGTALFGYNTLGQINASLDNLSASYAAIASMPAISVPSRTHAGEVSSTTPDGTSTTTPEGVSTTTPAGTSVPTNPADLKLSLVFPNSGGKLYAGCTYALSLQSSTTITSLSPTLIDAGTKEAVGPIASGLAKEYKIRPDSQTLAWRVGAVWQGEYFISMSHINGTEKEVQSKYFMIQNMPDSITVSQRENLCKESGGSLQSSLLQ